MIWLLHMQGIPMFLTFQSATCDTASDSVLAHFICVIRQLFGFWHRIRKRQWSNVVCNFGSFWFARVFKLRLTLWRIISFFSPGYITISTKKPELSSGSWDILSQFYEQVPSLLSLKNYRIKWYCHLASTTTSK